MTDATCATCRFADVPPAQGFTGQEINKRICRRFPPTAIALPVGPGQMATITTWPEVSGSSRCGEHKPISQNHEVPT